MLGAGGARGRPLARPRRTARPPEHRRRSVRRCRRRRATCPSCPGDRGEPVPRLRRSGRSAARRRRPRLRPGRRGRPPLSGRRRPRRPCAPPTSRSCSFPPRSAPRWPPTASPPPSAATPPTCASSSGSRPPAASPPTAIAHALDLPPRARSSATAASRPPWTRATSRACRRGPLTDFCRQDPRRPALSPTPGEEARGWDRALPGRRRHLPRACRVRRRHAGGERARAGAHGDDLRRPGRRRVVMSAGCPMRSGTGSPIRRRSRPPGGSPRRCARRSASSAIARCWRWPTSYRPSSSAPGPWNRCCGSPDVTDVLVNGPDEVWVDTGSGLRPHPRALPRRSRPAPPRPAPHRRGRTAARRRRAVRRRAAARRGPAARRPPAGGRRRDLPVAAGCPAAAPSRWTSWSPRAPSRPKARSARRPDRARAAFLITGGTGTGKTTLLSAAARWRTRRTAAPRRGLRRAETDPPARRPAGGPAAEPRGRGRREP